MQKSFAQYRRKNHPRQIARGSTGTAVRNPGASIVIIESGADDIVGEPVAHRDDTGDRSVDRKIDADDIVGEPVAHRDETGDRSVDRKIDAAEDELGRRLQDGFLLGGVFAGKILSGNKPAELPVEQATKIELLLNPPRRSAWLSHSRCSTAPRK